MTKSSVWCETFELKGWPNNTVRKVFHWGAICGACGAVTKSPHAFVVASLWLRIHWREHHQNVKISEEVPC